MFSCCYRYICIFHLYFSR